MGVRVRVYMTLKEKLGWGSREVELRGRKVRFSDLLNEVSDLKKILEEFGYENFMILINGRNVRLMNWLETEVSEGDVVDIFPPAGGG